MKKKILIVDNEIDLLNSVSEFLQINGYEAIVALNGEQAIEQLVACSPDLIICDINMAKMDGYEVLESVRNIKHHQDIPFLFLSGLNPDQHHRKGMINGADDFISKPFRFDVLIASIESALKKKDRRLNQIRELSNVLKSKLDLFDKINFLNNHEVRASLSKIIQTVELIKTDDLELDRGLLIIYESASQIENVTIDINAILHDDSQFRHNVKLLPKLSVKRIMAVDDDPTQLILNRLVISKLLKPEKLFTFTSARLALNSLRNDLVDIIFLDLNMPGTSGLDLLKRMKEYAIEIPVVILSSSLDPDQINSCFSFNNVINYLVKPLSPQKLNIAFPTF